MKSLSFALLIALLFAFVGCGGAEPADCLEPEPPAESTCKDFMAYYYASSCAYYDEGTRMSVSDAQIWCIELGAAVEVICPAACLDVYQDFLECRVFGDCLGCSSEQDRVFDCCE